MPSPRSLSHLPVPSPVALVVGGIVSVQVGAAIAKGLFDAVGPTTLVFLRLLVSTIVLLVAVRPRLRGRSREDWRTVVFYGLALGTMNWAIYQSFARIPLGIAVTVEFLGPLLVAFAGSRRARDVVWVVLAGLGVALLGLAPGGRVTAAGLAFAVLAGAAWAAYILGSKGTGARWEGLDGLAVASAIASLVVLPLMLARSRIDGTAGDLDAILSARVIIAAIAVGLLSSVFPYALEILALRRLATRVFGILMSLEPAAAAAAGLVLLGEVLGWTEWTAIGCVVVASIGATRSGRSAEAPRPTAT